MYEHLLGNWVRVSWTDPCGVLAQAEGVLETFSTDDGEVIAELDWGYGISTSAPDFRMEEVS